VIVGRFRVLRHFIAWRTNDKFQRINSTPWCVPISSVRKRPPLIHTNSPQILEAFNDRNKCAMKQRIYTGLWKINKEARFWKFFKINKLMILRFRPTSAIDTELSAEQQVSQKRSSVLFDDQFDMPFRDLSKCCFRRPLAESQCCQVSCSLPEHHATSAAQHAGTVLYLKQLPA
jgi:hypothetical protein